MCFPGLPAVMAGLAVASGGAQYLGARQQAKQQERYQRQAQAAERLRFQQEQTSMRMRQAQEQEAVGRELEQLSLRTRQAISRTKENPYAQALADDYIRQEGVIRASLLRQQELGEIATGLGLEQAGFATRQRQIGIAQPISRPNILTSVLQTGTAALGAYGAGLQLQSMAGTGAPLTSPTTSSTVLGGRYTDYQPLRGTLPGTD